MQRSGAGVNKQICNFNCFLIPTIDIVFISFINNFNTPIGVNMETKQATGATSFWWLKSTNKPTTVSKQSEREISSSLAEYLENEQHVEELDCEIDIPSILEEISRLSAKSPLGDYQKDIGQLSIDEIMREAEKIYMESSKSFEQLSQRSKTSLNISELSDEKSDNSTPTPTSLSPHPHDEHKSESDSDTESVKAPVHSFNYSMDFDSVGRAPASNADNTIVNNKLIKSESFNLTVTTSPLLDIKSPTKVNLANSAQEEDLDREEALHEEQMQIAVDLEFRKQAEELEKRDGVIKMLLTDNKGLKDELRTIRQQLNDLETQRASANSSEFERALETLKDTQELNTVLQLQVEEANKSNLDLRTSYDELITANNILERRLIDTDGMLTKYKSDFKVIQSIRDKLKENEFNISKQLEFERQQVKSLKQQMEKDAKCVMDLNRQIKEMERIIARKHPDSVSALIVASRNEDNSSTTRKVLEERIKSLEQEAHFRDAQNSQVFLDVQEKFNQMKLKYESHIEDLELHVNDLKSQLKRRGDTYDVYTQTIKFFDEKIPAKDTCNDSSQTDPVVVQQPPVPKQSKPPKSEHKEETHLIATIRGYQSDLNHKEKALTKLQKDMEELRKTNRRLQKEREGSLRNLTDKKNTDNKSTLTAASSVDDEIRNLRTERDKMKAQLCRIEEDYQALKAKRLQDLNTLQEAHEREMGKYLTNITPLREQLENQALQIPALKKQLMEAKEELAIITVERDHLNKKVSNSIKLRANVTFDDGPPDSETAALRKQLNLLELKYDERENRLRGIVHGLAQKCITNRSCEQCSARQQQLIGYKAELDQILATIRILK